MLMQKNMHGNSANRYYNNSQHMTVHSVIIFFGFHYYGDPTWNIGVSALMVSMPSSSIAGVMPTVCKNDKPRSTITIPTPYHKYLVGIISLAIDFLESLSQPFEVFASYFYRSVFSYQDQHELLSSKSSYSMGIVPLRQWYPCRLICLLEYNSHNYGNGNLIRKSIRFFFFVGLYS